MKYTLSQKAYFCGDKKDFETRHYPDTPCLIVHVKATEKKPDISARYEYFKQTFENGYTFSDIRCRRVPDKDKYIIEGQEQFGDYYMSDIQNIIETNKWREQMEEFVHANKDEKVFIWSGYSKGYWIRKKNEYGYTKNIDDAGIFKIKDAWEKVKNSDASKQIKFEIVN